MLTHLENETVLVAEARGGSADAFATLANQYARRIYRLAFNITDNREDAEDVLQEALLKAYTHLKGFRGESKFYTWLVRIAVNEALMTLRSRAGNRDISLDEPVETDDRGLMPREIEDWEDDPEERYGKAELQRILDETIQGLPQPLRVVFLLRDVEELSTEEAARILELSIPAAKSRLLRARLKIREQLNKHFKKGYPIGLQRGNPEAV